MFEVGKQYEIYTLSATEDGLCEHPRTWTVVAVEGTLLHLHQPAETEGDLVEFLGETPEENLVLNTASAFFHSARLVEGE